VIDLHAHVLPGIDDGPPTLEASLALARAAVASGTRVMVATPHINERYGRAATELDQVVSNLQVELDRVGIPLELRQGAEVAGARVADLDDSTLRRVALGGGEWILLETPFERAEDVEGAIRDLRARGLGVVLAHVERSGPLRRDPTRVRRMVEAGALVSITADSLRGRFGSTARRFAALLLREGLVHNVASDAHDAERRPPDMRPGLRAVGSRALVDYFTVDVPRAVLEGEPVPSRPPPERSWRRWLSRSSAGSRRPS
jgi:protein-tyrosine phosphatase